MTAPRLDSQGAFEHCSDVRLDAWVLCAEFVQRIVSDAQSGLSQDLPVDAPYVDLAPIWRAGDGAPSDEAAIGRIVRAAWEAVQGISRFPPEGLSPSPTTLRSNGAAGSGDIRFLSSPEAAVDTAPVDSVVHPPEAAVVPVHATTAPPETGPVPVHLTTSVAEPLTMPVSAATAVVVDPATVEQHETSVAQVDAVQVEGRPPTAVSTAPVQSPWFHVFTWTRNLGAIILLFVAWQLWGTSISQHQAQSQLKSEFDALRAQHATELHSSKSSKSTLISAATRVPSPGDGKVVAEIQIPAIGVDQYVVEGTTESDLSKGPGHYIGTAMPGQAGNVAIAGHRTTYGAPFNGLGRLVTGDRIILTTTFGRHLTYVVSGTPQAVSPSDVGVLNYFGDNRVTLTTCNPEFSSTQRLVVVGKLSHSPASPALKHLSYHVVNPAIASWNWSLVPAVGLEVCLLLLLALSYRRFGVWFGRTEKWLILVPLWAAGLYLIFGTLTHFLPAAL